MPLYRIRLEALYLFTFPCQDLPSIGQRFDLVRAEQSIPIAIALDKNSFPTGSVVRENNTYFHMTRLVLD